MPAGKPFSQINQRKANKQKLVFANDKLTDPSKTSAGDDPLEKAEAKKETGAAATEGMVGEDALDAAIGDEGDDSIAEQTSAGDDPLEKAEAKKESS
jgi:hypothetical protein